MEFLHSMGAKQKPATFPPTWSPSIDCAVVSREVCEGDLEKIVVGFRFRDGKFSVPKKKPGAKKATLIEIWMFSKNN